MSIYLKVLCVPQLMPPCAVVTMPPLAPTTVSVYCASVTNEAPTDSACDMVTMHVVLAPEHAPDQPANTDPPVALAVRVTDALALNWALHVVPQLMPDGTLVTVPAPLTRTFKPKVAAPANWAFTIVVADTVTEHVVLVPVQAPDQPTNAPPLGLAVRITLVPAG